MFPQPQSYTLALVVALVHSALAPGQALPTRALQRLGTPTKEEGNFAPMLAITPDGTILAGSYRDKAIRLWDSKSGQLLRTLLGAEEGSCDIAFSPDGKTLAAASSGRVQRWAVADGKELPAFKGHDGAIYLVLYSNDGSILATAGADRTARLWDAATGKALHVLGGHRELTSIAFALTARPSPLRVTEIPFACGTWRLARSPRCWRRRLSP